MSHYKPESVFGPEEARLRERAVDYIHVYRDDAVWKDTIVPKRSLVSRFAGFGKLAPEERYLGRRRLLHHHLVMVPVPPKGPIASIEKLSLRVPTPYYYRRDEQSEEYLRWDTPQWNDVFLDVWYEKAQLPENYHLNLSAFTRYQDAEHDLIINPDREVMGDLFIAIEAEGSSEGAAQPLQLSLETLHLLLQEYLVQPQVPED